MANSDSLGLLLTYFYGRLADAIGRKPVMILGFLGQVFALIWVIIICEFISQTVFSSQYLNISIAL
jgi:MFS family permease